MRLPKWETGGETVSTKAFPGIEWCIDRIVENPPEHVKEARAELANARRLLEAADSFLITMVDLEYRFPVAKGQALERAIEACRVSPQAMEPKEGGR